jgi:hypothetical protein
MPIQNVPVDDQAMQEELERDSGVKTTQQGAIYVLKKGITQLRVMPPMPGQQKFFREFREHPWNPGGRFRRDTCPTNLGDVCPVCDEGKRLFQTTETDSVAKSKKLRPRRQFILNAIILADPEGAPANRGVQVVRFGVKVKRQLVRYDRDHAGGWGGMTDLLTGFDVRIEKTGDTMETTEYFVHGVPTRTDIGQALAAQGIDFSKFDSYDLDLIAPPPTHAELTALLKEDFVPGFDNAPTIAAGTGTAVPVAQEAPVNAVVDPTPTGAAPVVAPDVPPPFTTEEK